MLDNQGPLRAGTRRSHLCAGPWAFNRFRDAIVYVSKNSSKVVSNEDEIVRKVDRSVNEIFFRAVTLMAVAVLRLASGKRQGNFGVGFFLFPTISLRCENLGTWVLF